MEKRRFSKSLTLKALDKKAADICKREGFNRSHGTAQLTAPNQEELVRLAVEYGRMRAFESFAESVEEGFMFDGLED